MLLKFRLDENGFVFSNPADLIAARSIDYIKCHFDIVDPIWKNTHAVVAVFKSATYNKYADVLLDSNNNCYIDPEVYKRGGVIQVKLIGDRYLNEEVISSTSITAVLEFKINENIIIPTNTPSKYDVFVAELEQAKATVSSALNDLADKLARGDFDGVGIDSVAYNVDGTLTITLTDGSEFVSEYSMKGNPGADGDDGVGITDIVQNQDGTLTVVLTDGSQYLTQPLKGEKGDAFTFDDFTPEQFESLRGERGLGVLHVTTPPTVVSDPTSEYKYCWSIATVLVESGVDYLCLGDIIEHGYYHYPVIAINNTEGSDNTVLTGDRISIRGATGETGNGIASIVKTGTSGLVDTYTITYTDGTTSTFEVTNGKDGEDSDVQDVQIDGTSILSDGVANIPTADTYYTSRYGVVKLADVVESGDNYNTIQLKYTRQGSAKSKTLATSAVATTSKRGLMSKDDKVKLDGIASGAEVNVQSDWNQTNTSADDYIKNKPSVPTKVSDLENDVPYAEEASLKSALPTDTASGDIASFPDGTDLFSALSVKAQIEPIQDLHGYDKPWTAGAGVNKLIQGETQTFTSNGVTWTANADGSITARGTAVGNSTFTYIMSEVGYTFNGNYKFVFFPSISATVMAAGIYIGKWISVYPDTTTSLNDLNAQIGQLWFQIKDGQTADVTFYPMIYSASETAPTSWTPYSNICPISGRTECVTEVYGKNLLDRSAVETTDKYVDLANNYYYTEPLKLKPNTQYTISPSSASSLGVSDYWVLYINQSADDADYLVITNPAVRYPVESGMPKTITFTTGATGTIRFGVTNVSGAPKPSALEAFMSVNWQIEVGSTATSYEPYHGNTYTTALGRTVYGGTLDVVSGELVVDRATKTLNGTESWSIYTTASLNQLYTSIPGIMYRDNTANVISDKFNSIPLEQRGNNYNTVYAYIVGVGFNVEGYSQASWQEFLAQNPVQIVYELATPQTYQLTPTEVDLLLGQNNVWTDCGSVEVTYKADVQRYIDKEREAVSYEYDRMIAPTETKYIATQNYTTGSLLIVDGVLYKVTSNIANGGTITPNTNCTATTLSEVISALA